VYVRVGLGADERVMPSSQALEIVGRVPHTLLAKEGLGLMNGTAVSAGVASLAIWESQRIAALAQICTAMATESLQGHSANFHPFFGQVRPHSGQIISARNILDFLSGSELAKHTQDNTSHQLRTLPYTTSHLVQDRYDLRTASQWIGPCLEDLSLAASQVSVELNSTTDNPIFATTRDYTDPSLLLFDNHCGGNFQALSVTMAMEKTRSALQLLGKLVFAQSSEIINPVLSNGLPANLSFDDPSLSFTCKGIDIGMAAYMSELASLANPVSNCVQSAEMHNQSINSLALVSARKTLEAVEVIRIMLATYLYLLCQALDLCVLQLRFKRMAESEMHRLTWRWFADTGTDPHSLAMDMNAYPNIGAVGQETRVNGDHLDSKATLNELALDLWRVIEDSWDSTGMCDLEERVIKAIASTSFVFSLYDKNTQTQDRKQNQVELANYSSSVQSWQYAVQSMLQKTYEDLRNEMLEAYLTITPTYLGRAGKIMYAFVRGDAPRGLGVEPCRGLVDMPGIGGVGRRPRKTIGSWISMIYESMLGGEGEKRGLFDVVEECMTVVEMDNGTAKAPLHGGC
jgi:phenylalanine ammonia-lyase